MTRGRWVAAAFVAAAILLLVARRAAPPVIDGADASSSAAGQGVVTAVGNVRRGHALLTAFRDSLPANSGNGLRCTSCHLDDGVRPTALSWLGTAARYPRYRSRRGGEETLAQRVNDCVTRSLAGRALDEGGRDMRDILAYLDSLGPSARPPVPDSVKLTGTVAAGERVFTAECARCHGANGEGLVAPAVWGVGSFAVSAGMARQFTFASFVRHNMPYDRAGTLTPQQAADVAAYVLAQPRQDHAGKEHDWPKGDPPSDVAYVTTAAHAAGKPDPAPRPLLPRVIQ